MAPRSRATWPASTPARGAGTHPARDRLASLLRAPGPTLSRSGAPVPCGDGLGAGSTACGGGARAGWGASHAFPSGQVLRRVAWRVLVVVPDGPVGEPLRALRMNVPRVLTDVGWGAPSRGGLGRGVRPPLAGPSFVGPCPRGLGSSCPTTRRSKRRAGGVRVSRPRRSATDRAGPRGPGARRSRVVRLRGACQHSQVDSKGLPPARSK